MRFFILIIFLLSISGFAKEPVQTYETVLSQLIEEATSNNPDLKAADYKARAAHQAARAVRTYDPPQFAVEFFQSPLSAFPNPLKDQMEIDYSFQQMIPFPGKLTALGDAEGAKAAMSDAEHKMRKLLVLTGIQSDFAELYFLRRKQDLNIENLALMRFHADVARARYGSGQDMAADVLRAESEIAALQTDSLLLAQQESSVEAMINAGAGRTQDSSIPRLGSLSPAILHFDYVTLCTLAVRNRPELWAMRSNIDMRDAVRAVAQKEFLPDFMIRGMYKDRQQSPEDYWSLMLGINVPIAFWSYGRFSSGSEEKRLSSLEARAALANMRNMVFAQIRDAQARFNGAQSRISVLTEKSIPLAKQALDAALSAYKSGTSTFLMVIDDQKMYFMAKIDQEMAVMERFQALSRLEQAVGTDPIQSLSMAFPKEKERPQ
ncbi:MAG: hypothetical protein A2293_04265 [Elusimicrobia bacterium RIFOXYB2_FULL_49_7]|nr:MAG: hypothetical protein A2293_04265 [Elusimicrobia bacterium RIFOXYB2_FULL_49_7]